MLDIVPTVVNLLFSFEVDLSPVSLGFVSNSSPIQTTIWGNEKSQFAIYKTTVQWYNYHM
jgi:hypothetical protein